MSNYLKNQKGFIPLLVFLMPNFIFCQNGTAFNDSSIFFHKELSLKKSSLSLEITASILPQAKISRTEGDYQLRSRLQSAYDAGVNYIYNLNKKTNISTGFHFVIGKRNFFVKLPENDLPGYVDPGGAPIIEDKGLWSAIRLPIIIEKKTNNIKNSLYAFKAGLNLRYSGLMSDESIGSAILDSNNQATYIFDSEFSGRNNNKPWITFLGGVSRLFILDNHNIIEIGLQADVSTAYFFKGSYTITIPNKPVTSGIYKINGTSLGLSVQYIFTGTNKRLLKDYQKQKAF